MTDRDLAAELLATRRGVAFLATGVASDRLEAALQDPGTTLCLAGQALREVDRGTDGGRLDELVAAPPPWLVRAAGAVAARDDLGWWSRGPHDAVHRQLRDGLTGIELVDAEGRARSLAEEAEAHLHTFTRQRAPHAAVRRWRPAPDTRFAVLDGPADWAAVGATLPTDVDGVHLTLRGALTIEPGVAARWPWEVAGTWWHRPVDGTPLPDDETGAWAHDHDWVGIGREHDPRFDEGDEVDGSELRGL